MPIWDIRCNDCQQEAQDAWASTRSELACACGSLNVETIPRKMSIDGPTQTRPMVVDQLGTTITDPGELRRYQKENPKHQIVDKNDSSWKRVLDKSREKSEKAAKAAGYRDWEDQQNHLRQKRGIGG